QARADIASAQANLTFSQQEYARYLALAQSGTGTVQRAQQAAADWRQEAAALQHNQATLDQATKQIAVLKTQRGVAEATMQHNQAALEQAKLNLGYAAITSPIDGAVGDRSARVGQYVQPGTQLMTIVPMRNGIYVVANFKETQIRSMFRGEAADITIDSFPGLHLKDIQGGIAASLDEGTWISTGYLVAEIVTIPLSAWLAGIFSMKRYLIANCALFLVFSMLCGLSDSLTMMVICRVGQGFTGSVFIPLAMTIVLRCLPPSKQPIGLTLFGVTATFAPATGPTIGGWLTDTLSWHWIFYINLFPGMVMMWTIWYGLRNEPMHLERLRRGDWPGIVSMAIGLGSLITVLEEGQRKDWFGNPTIVELSIAAAIFIPA